MTLMGAGIASDDRPHVGVGDPVEESRAQNARSAPALAGDHQQPARPVTAGAMDERQESGLCRVLGIAMQVNAGLDTHVAPTDATMPGRVFGRRRVVGSLGGRFGGCGGRS
jgi:hypothetical protein